MIFGNWIVGVEMFEKGLLNNQPNQSSSNHNNAINRSIYAINSNKKTKLELFLSNRITNICFRFSVWIGKNARSNDKLFNLAHKEDIWLHAKSVSGSHVIIRAHQKT